MFGHHIKMALLASTFMASEPPAEGQAAEEQPSPNIGSAVQAEGGELPEGFTSWEDYNQKGGVLPGETGDGGEDTTAGTEGQDTIEGGEALEETAEAKAKRVEETVKISTEGMAPEMAEKVTPFVKAFAETGTLTPEQITAAATATGMSEAMVNQYMEGAKALQAKAETEDTAAQAAFVEPFYKEFGGEAAYTEFQKWSAQKDSLTDDEAEAFNEALANSPKAALQMAKQFKARWEAEGAGADVVDLTRGSGAEASSDNQGYASMAEQMADMDNPQYREDPAFRAKVAAKIAKSVY